MPLKPVSGSTECCAFFCAGDGREAVGRVEDYQLIVMGESSQVVLKPGAFFSAIQAICISAERLRDRGDLEDGSGMLLG
jgi:hypothetical protein